MGESVSFGVGVYGYVNNFQYYNHKSLDNYLRLLENNRLPVWKGKLLSTEEQMRRKIIFNLKTTDGIDKASFERCFGTNPEELFAEKFEELEKRGLLENNSERIKLTYRGSLFEDEICQEFFSEEVKTAAESGKKQ